MISRIAIKKYLSRQMESFTWMKELDREDLWDAIYELDPIPRFHGADEPWDNQLVMFLLGVYFPQFIFFADMGTGKTRVILDLISYRKQRGERQCHLVTVLNDVNIENWTYEIEKFTPHLKYCVLEGPANKRLDLLNEDMDLFLTHYPGMRTLGSSLVKDTDGDKRHWVLDRKKIRVVQKKFNGLDLDESYMIMNKSSLTFRVCNQIAKTADVRFAMTGTPFGKDPLPLWSQFFVIDRGETLGPTLGLFREVFFRKVEDDFGRANWVFSKKRTKDLHRIIGDRSITYLEGECQNLPERVHIKRKVVFPKDIDKYYQTELHRLRKAKGNFREIKNSFLRMRQLSSGFLGLKNDDTGEKVQIEFPINPKLDELMEILAEIPAGKKVLIFHEYTPTGNEIARRLKKAGIIHRRIWGGEKDSRLSLRKFVKEPEVGHIVINNNSGASGLNMQVSHYEVFVESPVRPIIRQQAERRIRRSGQKAKRCFIIDIIMKSSSSKHSVDEKILEGLNEGRNLLSRILKGEEMI